MSITPTPTTFAPATLALVGTVVDLEGALDALETHLAEDLFLNAEADATRVVIRDALHSYYDRLHAEAAHTPHPDTWTTDIIEAAFADVDRRFNDDDDDDELIRIVSMKYNVHIGITDGASG